MKPSAGCLQYPIQPVLLIASQRMIDMPRSGLVAVRLWLEQE
jgi:hypothetical protein